MLQIALLLLGYALSLSVGGQYYCRIGCPWRYFVRYSLLPFYRHCRYSFRELPLSDAWISCHSLPVATSSFSSLNYRFGFQKYPQGIQSRQDHLSECMVLLALAVQKQ